MTKIYIVMYSRNLRELLLDLTDKCPLRCIYCSANSGPANYRFMSMAKIFEILEDASRLGLEVLSLSGGEPLLHPGLLDIIDHAMRLEIKDIRLFTSGVILNQHIPSYPGDDFFKNLREVGLKKIFFNLQGATADVHDKICGVEGVFNHVIRGIKASSKAGLYVGIHFVPIKSNWATLPEVFRLCTDLNVDEVAVLRFVPHGRGERNKASLALNDTEYLKFLKILNNLADRNDKPKMRIGCPFNDIQKINPEWPVKKCTAGESTCHILIDGNIAPCSASKWMKELYAGNIYNEKFIEAWNKGFQQFNKLRNLYASTTKCTIQEIIGKNITKWHMVT